MKNIETRKIVFSNNSMSYNLTRKNVKNINLRIKSDGTVWVSAHESISVKKIEAFIISRWNSIQKHMRRFDEMKKYEPVVNQYTDGDEFYLLGNIVKLKVMESSNESIFIDGEYIYLKVRDKEDKKRKEVIVERFFDKFSREYLENILEEVYPMVSKYGIEFPNLKIRNMKSRWGSCMPYKKQINLNKKLVHVPKECIEYVVLHEYAHFIHLNHSKNFYKFVETLMPDYKDRKALLSGYGAIVL